MVGQERLEKVTVGWYYQVSTAINKNQLSSIAEIFQITEEVPVCVILTVRSCGRHCSVKDYEDERTGFCYI